MFKQHARWFPAVILLTAILVFLFHPVFLKKRYIQKHTNIELTESAKVIDYRIELDPLFGVDLPYVKMEIDQDTYNSIDICTFNDINSDTKSMHHILNKSINLETIEEFKCGELMGSKASLIAGTTRMTYYILTKEISGNYYFYFYTY